MSTLQFPTQSPGSPEQNMKMLQAMAMEMLHMGSSFFRSYRRFVEELHYQRGQGCKRKCKVTQFLIKRYPSRMLSEVPPRKKK